MVSDHDQIGPVSAQKPEQLELRDIGVLKFVNQNIAVTRAKPFAQRLGFAALHNASRICVPKVISLRSRSSRSLAR